MATNPQQGFVLLCQRNGEVESVIRDDFKIFSKPKTHSFYSYLKEEDIREAEQFFSNIQQLSPSSGHSFHIVNEGTSINVIVAGAPYGYKNIIIGASTSSDIYFFYDDLMQTMRKQFLALTKVKEGRQPDQMSNLKREGSLASNVFFDEERSCPEEQTLRALQEKLAEKEQALSNKRKELDKFAHIVSHDLKAPLSRSKLIVHLLQKKLQEDQLSKDTQQLLEMLLQSTSHMSELVDTIHNYSKSGLFDFNVSTFSVDKLFNEIISLDDISGKVKFHYSPQLPEITANRKQLFQVLYQLISNAVKYHHKLEGNITLLFEEEEKAFLFEVIDDGPGIPEEYHQNIFEIFNKGGNRISKKTGVGVGLSIVKKLIENAGGEIFVESKVGKGSNFKFTWPKPLEQGKS